MAARLRRAWADLPRWARWVLAVYLIGFAEGTGAHVRDLVRGGIHAYSSVPQAWIQVFFVSLVVLDPLVVVLIAFVRREGIWLAAGVMVLDVAANWTGNWPSLDEDPARLLRPGGLAAHHAVRRVRSGDHAALASRHEGLTSPGPSPATGQADAGPGRAAGERLPVREIDKVIDRANVHDAAPDHSRPGIADCALSL